MAYAAYRWCWRGYFLSLAGGLMLMTMLWVLHCIDIQSSVHTAPERLHTFYRGVGIAWLGVAWLLLGFVTGLIGMLGRRNWPPPAIKKV